MKEEICMSSFETMSNLAGAKMSVRKTKDMTLSYIKPEGGRKLRIQDKAWVDW